MNYSLKFLFLFLFFVLFSCVSNDIKKSKGNIKKAFVSKGFTLVYTEDLYKKKIIKKKINPRDLVIIHSSLKPKTYVRLYNPENAKSLVVQVKYKSPYSVFYNSVITKRISEELELDFENPYIELFEINTNNKFIAKKAKTFEEEKNVANKAPVDEINIKNISINKAKSKKKNKDKNSYIIRVVDFYYLESANTFKSKLQKDLNLSNINIKEVSPNKFRVFCGPFNSLNDIKDTYLSISNLGFEQLDIIKIN
tara:strand:+ start:1374 stop:2129 length:756 start_codon:yes stop_codon:yes gene_type:complete